MYVVCHSFTSDPIERTVSNSFMQNRNFSDFLYTMGRNFGVFLPILETFRVENGASGIGGRDEGFRERADAMEARRKGTIFDNIC